MLVEINDNTRWYWHWLQSEQSFHSVNHTHGCQPLKPIDYLDWLVRAQTLTLLPPYCLCWASCNWTLVSLPLLPPVCSSQRGGSNSSGRRSPTFPGSQVRPWCLREDQCIVLLTTSEVGQEGREECRCVNWWTGYTPTQTPCEHTWHEIWMWKLAQDKAKQSNWRLRSMTPPHSCQTCFPHADSYWVCVTDRNCSPPRLQRNRLQGKLPN